MSRHSKFTAFMLVAAMTASLALGAATAYAGWFGKKKDKDHAADAVQTYQPPPPEAQETYCEPIRQKILGLNRRPFVVKFFSFNRLHVAKLKDDHKDCILGIKEQQIEYLRHVDNPQAPSLPPLQVEGSESR